MNEQAALRQDVARRLRLARDMAGLTQAQVANVLGWHRPTVSEIEAGRRRVSAEEVLLLANLYGVNTPWIFGEESSELTSDKAMLAARELNKLKDEDLDRLLQVLQALKSSEGNGED